ncbi:MAG: oligosaccharide flippase family protein [Egibacteraceae bacterium]
MLDAEPFAPAGGPLGTSRRSARNASVRAAGEVIGKGASAAFFIVMARQLGPDDFGAFVFALSLSTVFILASGFGTEELVSREVARDPERVHSYLANVVAIKGLSSVVLLLAVFVTVNLTGQSPDARLATYIVAVGVAVENLGRTWNSVFTAYERLAMISISLVVQRTLTAAVGIALLLSGSGLITVSIVFSAGAVLGLLVTTQVLHRFVVVVRWRLDRSMWLPLVRAGVPIGLVTLVFTVLMRVDVVLLGVLTGGEDNNEVGFYGAAFRLVEATLFISWAFSSSVLPWLARRDDRAAIARGYELGAKVITAVLMPIGLGFVLLAPELVALLYGSGYDDAVLPLRLLGVMTLLYGISSLTATVLISRDRPLEFGRVLALVAVENVVLNVILIPRYGADAAAFNAALSALILAVSSLVLIARRFGTVNPLRAFAAPVVGGAAMSAVIVVLSLPLVPAVVVGGLAYLAGTIVFERIAFPADFKQIRDALPLPTGRRPGRAA